MGASGGFLGVAQRRQQECGEDSEDGNHDEQFDQSECPMLELHNQGGSFKPGRGQCCSCQNSVKPLWRNLFRKRGSGSKHGIGVRRRSAWRSPVERGAGKPSATEVWDGNLLLHFCDRNGSARRSTRNTTSGLRL